MISNLTKQTVYSQTTLIAMSKPTLFLCDLQYTQYTDQKLTEWVTWHQKSCSHLPNQTPTPPVLWHYSRFISGAMYSKRVDLGMRLHTPTAYHTWLWYQFKVISFYFDFVLGSSGSACDTGSHPNSSGILLPQEIPDLHHRVSLTHAHIDGKVSIHCTHLVLEPLRK